MAINYDSDDQDQDGFTPEQLDALVERANDEQVRLALKKFLHAMSELGFGTDDDISGAEAVGAIGDVFAEVTEGVLPGQG